MHDHDLNSDSPHRPEADQRRPAACGPSCCAPRGVRFRQLALFALLLTGCRPTDDAAPADSPATNVNATTMLREAIERYQSTAHYHDQGRLRLEYELNGNPTVEETEIGVDFARPNQLRLRIERGVNRLTVASDGRQMWAAVVDPASQDLRHQVVQRPAPRRPTVAELYATTEMIDPANPDQMMSVLMGLPLNLHTSQLGLLLPDSAFLELLNRSTDIRWLAAETIDDAVCDRIEVSDAIGRHVFWIDQASRQIRRIEYPTQELFQVVPAEQRPQNVRLVLDLNENSFDRLAPSTFALQRPAEAKPVQYFVLPPSPLPSERFGQEIRAMTFTDCDGVAETSQDWPEKILVLIWFDRHPASQFNVTKLEDLYKRYADQGDQVIFRAICVERPDSLSAEGVRQLAEQSRWSIPVTRDLAAAGREALDISEAPTIVVLDRKHRLQMFEVGTNPEIDASVQLVLQRLLAGDNVAADVVRNHALMEDQFQRQLQLAGLNPAGDAPSQISELAPAADFRKLQASTAWSVDEIVAPGNLLLISLPNETAARLLALDGMRDVVELGADGQIVARHPLDLAEGAFVGQLRYRTDGRGAAYFLGFSQFGRHVFLFDQQFRGVLSYPAADQQHNGIMDAELLDLDQDGELELYVAFAEPHGCHRVDLTGRRVWSNRRLPATLSLSGRTLARPARLLATGERGWLLPISAAGQEDDPVTVRQRTIHQIVASDNPTARPTHFLGMSYSIEGRLIAVGLDQWLQEQWSYGLPAGVFRHQVRSPLWAPLWGAELGCWLLAGPDGSVHIVRDDGSFFDHVNLGDDVLGLAGHGSQNGGRLYIATPGRITAYDLAVPEG